MSPPPRPGPGCSWKLRIKCLFNRGMKDFDVLISVCLQHDSHLPCAQPCAWEERRGGQRAKPCPPELPDWSHRRRCVKAGVQACCAQGYYLDAWVPVGGVALDRARTLSALAWVPMQQVDPGGGLSPSSGLPSSCRAVRLLPRRALRPQLHTSRGHYSCCFPLMAPPGAQLRSLQCEWYPLELGNVVALGAQGSQADGGPQRESLVSPLQYP